MRILINLLNFRPGKIGGTETYLRELIGHLPGVAKNERISLVTSRDVARHFVDSPLEVVAVPYTTAQICGLRFLETAAGTFHARSIEAAIARTQPDVILYPQQSMFPKSVSCPSVLVTHDLYHLTFPDYCNALQRWFRNRSYPAAIASADHILTASVSARRTIVDYVPAAADRISIVPHGIRELDARCILPYEGIAGPYLYYPAVTRPHKNHELLFHSVAALCAEGRFPYRLILTGEKTKHWQKLERLLPRLALTDVVSHLGYVSYSTVLKLIRGAECVVFPSRCEGFGIPVIEAASLDCKVITSQLEVFAEIGVPPAYRIDFADHDALARAITDQSPAKLLRKPATWAECARGTLDVLCQTAEIRLPRPIGPTPPWHMRRAGLIPQHASPRH